MTGVLQVLDLVVNGPIKLHSLLVVLCSMRVKRLCVGFENENDIDIIDQSLEESEFIIISSSSSSSIT